MSPTPARPFILLVDDEQDLIEVLSEALELAMPDYDVVAVTQVDDAEAAIEQRGGPALLCVDHKLGERNGLELLESLRSRFPEAGAMLLTGQAPADVESRAVAMGARVIWKPIPLARWIAEVRALLPA